MRTRKWHQQWEWPPVRFVRPLTSISSFAVGEIKVQGGLSESHNQGH